MVSVGRRYEGAAKKAEVCTGNVESLEGSAEAVQMVTSEDALNVANWDIVLLIDVISASSSATDAPVMSRWALTKLAPIFAFRTSRIALATASVMRGNPVEGPIHQFPSHHEGSIIAASFVECIRNFVGEIGHTFEDQDEIVVGFHFKPLEIIRRWRCTSRTGQLGEAGQRGPGREHRVHAQWRTRLARRRLRLLRTRHV